jgi:hypothetical protein
MVNRDQVIAYLLHEMPETERAAFAEQWFSEPELYESVRMAEAALLDDYVRHRVSRRQRRRIERYLLASDVQRRKLAFAAALQAALPQPRRWRAPWVAIAAAVLVALAGASIWLGVENRNLRQEAARRERAVQPEPGAVYTVGLPADTLRGASAETTVRLPAGVSMLRLELELRPPDQQNVYTATVSAGGRTLWSEGPLRVEARGTALLAPVWIPAGVLSTGEHTVQLETSGSPVAYYRFTVVR